MKFIFMLIAIGGLLSMLGTPVFADGDPVDEPGISVEKEFNDGRVAIYGGKFDQAIALMKIVVAEEPDNADAHNYLGFAYRKTGRLQLAATSYEKALDIDPKHISALEYQGEMYLTLNDLNSARQNLTRLEQICGNTCKQRKELEEAINAYLNKRGSPGSS